MKNGHCTWLCAFGVPIQVVCAGEEGGGTAICIWLSDSFQAVYSGIGYMNQRVWV